MSVLDGRTSHSQTAVLIIFLTWNLFRGEMKGSFCVLICQGAFLHSQSARRGSNLVYFIYVARASQSAAFRPTQRLRHTFWSALRSCALYTSCVLRLSCNQVQLAVYSQINCFAGKMS